MNKLIFTAVLFASSVFAHAQSITADGIYKFSKNTEVVPEAAVLNGYREANIGGVSMDVYKDEPVAIEFLHSGEVLMTIRLPEEEVGRVPEQFILSEEEFRSLKLKMISNGGEAELKAKYTGYFDTQVAGRGGAKMRDHRFRTDASGRIAGGGGNCVRVVKALTGFSGTAGNGVGMASALQSIGYRSVSFNSLRRGAVCSWSGGFHGMGHVGWFDGRCFQPTYGGNCGNPGSNYRLSKCVARR